MAKGPSASDTLAWLDQVDSSLQDVTKYLDLVFEDIESCPQVTVDYLCETAGDYVSYVLEYGKVKILNGLGAQKKAVQDVLDKYGPLAAALEAINNPSLDTIVSWACSVVTVIKMMYQLIIKPYQDSIQFLTQMTAKIISISNSMQRLASYTPPKAPDVNFNKFKITFQPFSVGDIGTDIPYPDPPEVKPFPNPFSDTIALAKSMKKSNKISGGESNSSDIA